METGFHILNENLETAKLEANAMKLKFTSIFDNEKKSFVSLTGNINDINELTNYVAKYEVNKNDN